MTVHTTDTRNENNSKLFAEVIYNRTARCYNVLVCKRSARRGTWNRWMGDNFRSADAAIRYAEVTVANWNL